MTDNSKPSGLSLGNFVKQQHFNHVIDGIYGSFTTPAGQVCYLQTKAKVGGDGSTHSQLTQALVPAREALDIKGMDFNQLLQRDLDDHRIATKLIPYILNPPSKSLPGFYPPVVAVLLPFDHQQKPLKHFEPPQESIERDHQYGLTFRMDTHGDSCRIQYLVDDNGQPTSFPLAVLRWNPDAAKLVIMDGQHRAMSLLAIERTITNSWKSANNGARYQPFYEEHVRKGIQEAKKQGLPVDLSHVELPVTICWFPDTNQGTRTLPHRAARKLFVDVNNTAKPPSEARLVLLSDTELENIFARELLNRLRQDEQWQDRFPLFGVEYDNPNSNVTTPRRWNVVTNLEILKDAVKRVVFGPDKIIDKPLPPPSGKPNWKEMNKYMRKQLQVDDLFSKEFHDGERRLEREALGNGYFPLDDVKQHKKLLDAFYSRWGQGILYLLSEVEPYKAHLTALRDRYNNWTVSDNIQTLAKDALFEGVGMFWTIEDGHKLWQEQKQEALDNLQPLPARSDISHAWTILDSEQRDRFRRRRCEVYLKSSKDKDLEDCDRLYQGLITYAAQVGLVLTWASIHRVAAPDRDPFAIAQTVAAAINQALTTGPVQSRDRRLCLLKKSDLNGFRPWNELPRLDPTLANSFRYFWLELLLIETNYSLLEAAGIDLTKAQAFFQSSRQTYLKLLVEEQRKQNLKDPTIRRLSESQQTKQARKKAIDDVVESQAQGRCYWFGGKIDVHRQNIAAILQPKASDGLFDSNNNGSKDDEGDNDDDTDQI